MSESKTKDYRDRLTGLESDRNTWLPDWVDIDQYLLPGRGVFMTRGDIANRGGNKHSRIYDGTALWAMRILGAGLHGGLTSPARPWFRPKLADEEMEEFGPVKIWLHDVQKILMNIYSQSNFYTVMHQGYEELGGFGTAPIYQEEDDQKVVRFRLAPAGTYCLDVDSNGIVDTEYFHWWMTAKQMVEKFGKEKVSERVKTSFTKGTNDRFQVVHAVQPNKGRDVSSPRNDQMPYESVYFEYEGNMEDVLERSGYHENPCHCPRWLVAGSSVYGRGPGFDVLADTKMLQSMVASRAKGVQKMVDPPTMQPSSFKQKLKITPGAQNFVDKQEWTEGIKPVYQVNFDTQGVSYLIEDVRSQIRTGLYTDLFLMLQGMDQTRGGRDVTATEIAERHEEKLLMLGPVIERQFHELHDPLITRTFNIALRKGLIPPWPEELEKTQMSIEYVSLLAQAQKLVGTQSLNALTGFVGQLAQVNPDVLDKIDFDEAVDQYADMVGTPAKVIRSDDKVKEIRAAKAQAMADAQKQEQMAGMVEGAHKLSQTDTEGKNALTDLTESIEGGV